MKKKLTIMIILLLSIITIIVMMIHNPVYNGSIKVISNTVKNGNYLLTIEMDGRNEEVSLNNVQFSKNGKKVFIKEVWNEIKTGNNYQVLLIKNRFPYSIFKEDYTIKKFYLD